MDTRATGAVVVGVTGRGRETSALRFAAEHARREGARVVLVHVGRVSLPTVPGLVITPDEAISVAARIVCAGKRPKLAWSSGSTRWVTYTAAAAAPDFEPSGMNWPSRRKRDM